MRRSDMIIALETARFVELEIMDELTNQLKTGNITQGYRNTEYHHSMRRVAMIDHRLRELNERDSLSDNIPNDIDLDEMAWRKYSTDLWTVRPNAIPSKDSFMAGRHSSKSKKDVRILELEEALNTLTTVNEFQIPAIRGGIDVEHRLEIIAKHTIDARSTLNNRANEIESDANRADR